jgi:hypothetical protein
LLDDDLMNNGAARESESSNRTLERAVYLAELALALFAP